MIISKIRTKNGFAFIEADFCENDVEILFFAQKEDLNIHQYNYWSNIDGNILKDNHELYIKNVDVTAYGQNNNVLVLSDMKLIRAELKNVIDYMHRLRKSVAFAPLDNRRFVGTKRLLKGIQFTEKTGFCGTTEFFTLYIVNTQLI